MTFRPATPADIPDLLRMQEAYYSSEGYAFVASTKEKAMRQLATDPHLGRLLAIEAEGSLAGYLAITFGFSLEFGGRDAFVDELYISPHARARGLGREAIAVAERACRDAGITALHLEVEYANSTAKALYASSGFVEHSRHLMTKRLGG